MAFVKVVVEAVAGAVAEAVAEALEDEDSSDAERSRIVPI